MAARKKTAVAKSAAITKTLETAVANLDAALSQADNAVKTRSAESKKLMTETRRMKKRRTTLMGKKKRATAADKKNSTADSRKTIRALTSEISSIGKSLVKATASRQAVLAELSGLKDAQKKLGAYVKGINAADRQMAKPKKRRAKRKS